MILQVDSCRPGSYTKKREVALSGSIPLTARQCVKGAVYQGHSDYASFVFRGSVS